MTRVLLIGSNGFIGSAINNYLHESCICYSTFDIKLSVDTRHEYIQSLKDKILAFDPTHIILSCWKGIPDLGAENSLFNVYLYDCIAKTLLLVDPCKQLTLLCLGSCFEYAPSRIDQNIEPLITYNTPFSLAKNICRSIIINISLINSNIKLRWLRVFLLMGQTHQKVYLSILENVLLIKKILSSHRRMML